MAAEFPLALITSLGAKRLRLHSLSAAEEMGRLYEFNVVALADDAGVDVAALLGSRATVAVELPDGSLRHFSGLVAAAGLDGDIGRQVAFRLQIRPWLWWLTRRSDTRIFQNKSVEEILKQVFDAYEHDVAFELSGSLPKLDYCVQYRETDFNFVSRLMENEGVYYYFRHASQQHTLVVVNKMSAHTALPGFAQVPFRALANTAPDTGSINQWRTSLEVQPGKVTLDDYDFTAPDTALKAEHASTLRGAKPALEHYDPPGDYRVKADGDRYAALRMEEIEARHRRANGNATARGIAVGHRFTLIDHPVTAQNIDHVVVASRIEARQSGYESGQAESHFSCSFTAMVADDVFRPQRLTPKPTVPGPQTARVVGPSGEEIHTDEYGRVKLQFHWDRIGKKDENSSCWVRVSQPLAGKAFGMVALPRIGQEVVVDFLEGDPDRPLVTGRVYNAVQTVPYKLPDNKTVATLKSRSSKDGAAANFNELRFEDKKGSEYIWFQAEKDFYQYVKNDAHLKIDHDQTRIVGHDLKEEIKNEVHRTIGKDLFDKVAGNQHLDLAGDSASKVAGKYGLKVSGELVLETAAALSAKSGADMVQKVGANLGVDAAANVHIKGGANVVIEAGAMLTLKCGGASVVIGPANVSITGAMVLINSGGGAGSGSGASPKTPAAVTAAAVPKVQKDPLQS